MTRQDVVDRAKSLLGWYYVYGAKFENNPITVDLIKRLRAQNSQVYTDSYYNKTLKAVGHNGIDCSGLVCYAMDISDIGSWYIHSLPEIDIEFCLADKTKPEPGDIAWRSGHVAIIENATTIIEAKGVDYGVIRSPYNPNSFTELIRRTTLLNNYYENIGWNITDGKWWYAYGHNKGEYYHGCFATIDGKMYLFDENGYLISGGDYITDSDGAFLRVDNIVYMEAK